VLASSSWATASSRSSARSAIWAATATSSRSVSIRAWASLASASSRSAVRLASTPSRRAISDCPRCNPGDRSVAVDALGVEGRFERLDARARRPELDQRLGALGLLDDDERLHPGDFGVGLFEPRVGFVALAGVVLDRLARIVAFARATRERRAGFVAFGGPVGERGAGGVEVGDRAVACRHRPCRVRG